MDRPALDRLRDIWRRFGHRELEPLEWAIVPSPGSNSRLTAISLAPPS